MLNEIHNVEMTNEIKNASVNEMENATTLMSLLRAGFSLVGLELVMFAFAIVVYFLFMGPLAGKTPKKWEEEEKKKAPKEKKVTLPASTPERAEKEASPKAEKTEKTDAKVDVAKHVALIRAKSKENDLDGATQVFRNLQASGAPMTPLVYNALLDSCVQCGKVGAALKHFGR